MRSAPWPIGAAFGLAIATLILLVGPLLLFNPLFTSALQVRHGVAGSFGTSQAQVDHVTTEMLVDLATDGDFQAAFSGRPPLLDARERSHMHDVARLVRLLALLVGVAALVAVVGAIMLRREPRRQGRIMLLAAGAIGLAAVVLGAVFAVAFDAAFLAFHELLFPPGTFLFEPGSNLITLFPEGFWFDASLAAGAAVVIGAVLVAAIGWWRWRAGTTGAEG
jgi:integral membrane protein (TIGR01906 family)